MMPAAAAAMFMKVMSSSLLRRFGYRQVLVVNTVLIACGIASYSLVGPGTPIWAIVPLGLVLGLFNSLQFSSLNTMAYADIESADASMASTVASTLQQMSLSFGLAVASLVTAFFLADLPQSDHVAVTRALHHGYLTMSALTLVSSLAFWGLRKNDGESVSKGAPVPSAEPRQSELS
jgi:MFS family permease